MKIGKRQVRVSASASLLLLCVLALMLEFSVGIKTSTHVSKVDGTLMLRDSIVLPLWLGRSFEFVLSESTRPSAYSRLLNDGAAHDADHEWQAVGHRVTRSITRGSHLTPRPNMRMRYPIRFHDDEVVYDFLRFKASGDPGFENHLRAYFAGLPESSRGGFITSLNEEFSEWYAESRLSAR